MIEVIMSHRTNSTHNFAQLNAVVGKSFLVDCACYVHPTYMCTFVYNLTKFILKPLIKFDWFDGQKMEKKGYQKNIL